MRIYGLLLFLLVSACLSSSSDKHPREGARYTIICKYVWQQCYARAQKRCEGRGYKLINDNQTMKTGGPEGRYREFSLLIQCN